jgi:2-polyprenyl-3-methyl-5-hydroxy-6-metoxy-1,4-benzoquinol methylase
MRSTRSSASDVLASYQRVSPSALPIEDDPAVLAHVEDRLHNILFSRLKLPRIVFRDRTVADLGCGTGEKNIILARWGAACHGIDFNPDSIGRAKAIANRFGLTDRLWFGVQDVHKPRLPKTAYDFVICNGVLPHVENPEGVIGEMARLVAPDGFAVVGYLDSGGNIQRLLHGAITRLLAKGAEPEEIERIAYRLFPENLDRFVKYGGRDLKAVINDYICNRHSYGLDTLAIIRLMHERGLGLYSSYPLQPRLVNASPTDQINDTIDPLFVRYQQLLWMLAATENDYISDVEIPDLFGRIEAVIAGAESSKADLGAILDAFDALTASIRSMVNAAIAELTHVIDRLCDGTLSETQITGLDHLFRGFNGFGTCYLCFHKQD